MAPDPAATGATVAPAEAPGRGERAGRPDGVPARGTWGGAPAEAGAALGKVPEQRLRRPVPRLDSPTRVVGIPLPQARWLGGGLLPALLVAGVLGGDAWGDWRLYALLVVGFLVGCLGAFARPYGRDLLWWAEALAGFACSPRRAVWRPAGARPTAGRSG